MTEPRQLRDFENGHIGVVKAVEGKVARVEFKRNKSCGECKACLTLADDRMETAIDNVLDAKVGDSVLVAIRSSKIVDASMIAFGIPVVLLVAGLWLGGLVSELGSVIGGAIALGISYWVFRLIEPYINKKGTYKPQMIRIVQEEQQPIEEMETEEETNVGADEQ